MSPTTLKLDPPLRQRLAQRLASMDRREEPNDQLKRAAVALVVVGGEAPNALNEASVILTRRALHLNRHSGQFALPGGRIDPGETAVQAALRELQEEVGLELEDRQVLGKLDDYVTRSGFHITAVVVWGGDSASDQLKPNPEEVAAVHRVPLSQIAQPDTRHLIEMEPGLPPVLSLAIVDTLVFAPTAAVMLQLARLAVDGEVERVHGFEEPRFAWS